MSAKQSDFFNLDSTSSEDSDGEKLEEKIKEWDWDAPENRDKFYSDSTASKTSCKRTISASKKWDSNKKLKNNEISLPSIEKISDSDNEGSSNNDTKLLYRLNGHKSSVNRVHWCKRYDMRNLLLSSSMDSKVIVWNLSESRTSSSQNQVFDKIHIKAVRNAIWFNNDSQIASISFDSTCAISDISGKEVNRMSFKDMPTAICEHQVDSYTVLIGAKNEVFSWDTRTNKTSTSYKSLMGQVQDIIFLNNESFCVSGDVVSKESALHSIMVWDFKSGAVISDQIFHEKYICTSLKKHPINANFYAQTHGNYIAEFSSRSPFKMNKYKRYESADHICNGYSIGCDINQHGTLLASGSWSGQSLIYNIQTSQLVHKLEPFSKSVSKEPCMDAKFNKFSGPKDKYLFATSSWNGSIKIYEI